jgi:hypothetical protein
MYPQGGAMHLQLISHSGTDGQVFWQRINPGFELPVGSWMTIEAGYRMGDATTGRMIVIVTDETTGVRRVVFDVIGATYDPRNDEPGGIGPMPLTKWNPQKLYSSDNVIHFIRDAGGVAQAYFDDFAFSGEWPPNWP